MEKRKVFRISIIDKEISRVEFDRNTFYTSDSELSLVFKLIEKGYSYDHGEILLYNEDDKSFVTRPITKKENDFVYEIESDIIPHYGTWKAQLQLVKDGDVYTSKPFEFVIENDLSNLAPQPTLTDINNWSTLKQSANELIDEMQDIIVSIEKDELERVNKENYRQQTELERVNNEQARQNSELKRENQENKRQQSELKRENNEKQRRIAEFERVDKENARQQYEQVRVSAEEERIENENKRNLTSVDEFIKLQNAVGGRNIIFNSDKVVANSNYALTVYSINVNEVKANNDYSIMIIGELSDGQTGWYLNLRQIINNVEKVVPMVTMTENDRLNQNTWVKTFKIPVDNGLTGSVTLYSLPLGDLKNSKIEKIKLTKGEIAIPYTKAPEDYTMVTKDDYFNHVELINNEKNNQFKQLKQAVIALGGTI